MNQFTDRLLNKPMHGIAIKVSDSDNLRFFHLPPLLCWLRAVPLPTTLSKSTLNIRIAGIDAPECAHFGHPGQPGGQDAKAWLTERIQGRRITIIPHRIDQFNRVVATVLYTRFWLWTRNLALDMVDAGWAVVYKGGGAEYYGMREKLMEAEERAKRKRRGIWKANNVQTPMGYVQEADKIKR